MQHFSFQLFWLAWPFCGKKACRYGTCGPWTRGIWSAERSALQSMAHSLKLRTHYEGDGIALPEWCRASMRSGECTSIPGIYLAAYFDQRDPQHMERRLVQRLER